MHTIHRPPKIVCLLLFSLSSLSAFAQASIEKHYLFTHYNTQNGLINNVIYSMAQDRHGFVWLGSDLGLTRFDGKVFYHKAIPEIYNNSAFVEYIETTDKGNIVCTAAMQGIFEQLDDGSFNNYYRAKRIGRNMYSHIKQNLDGKLLIVSSRSLYRVENDTLFQFYDNGSDRRIFNTIDVDSDNAVWFGGIEGLGVMESSGSEYKTVFIPELKDIYIVQIIFDNEGILHVGTAQGYYRIKFDEPYHNGSKYTITQPFENRIASFVNHLYIDKEQNLWISTNNNGAYRTKDSDITLHLTTKNGLLSQAVMCVMQDREGNYWFGTNNGLSIVADFNSYMLAKDGKLFQDANSITLDAFGRIWMPGLASFCVYQNEQLHQLDLKNTPFENGGVQKIVIDNQSVMWLYNPPSLFRISLTESLPDLKKAEKVADLSVYNSSRIMSIITDKNGVWICVSRKILHFNNNRLLPVTFNHPDSSAIHPQVVVQDKFGYYWIGDYTYGLYRGIMTEDSKNRVVLDDIKVYKSLDRDSSFVTAWIQDLSVDNEGHLWEASLYTGAYRHTLDSTGVVSSKLYSPENGLSSNMVTGIDCKKDGRIWLYTQNGICILTQDAEGGESFVYLNKKTGVDGEPFSSIERGNQLFTLTDEALFVTSNKISSYEKNNIPNVVITGLSVNGVDYTTQIYKKTLSLGHAENNLAFEFASITFSRAEDIRFQYKLDGGNDDWSNLSDRGFVEYSALSHGKYTFKVRAAMEDGTIGEETSFTFKISPAYYQTVWFYLLILMLISTVVYLFYKNRINHVIKTERMRSRIASDLHDDIGSTLSSIFLMSEIAGSSDKQSRLAEALRIIGNNSRDILNSMDDIIWSVNPQDDSLTSLTVRLREYAIPVCEAKNITLCMNIEDTTNGLKLGMDERRNIFLIVKEAINNAVKHSGCTTLEVTFNVYHKQTEVSIIDNGRGFNPQSPSSRNGLVNMKRRAQQIESELTIRSEKDKGTSIKLKTKNHIFI